MFSSKDDSFGKHQRSTSHWTCLPTSFCPFCWSGNGVLEITFHEFSISVAYGCNSLRILDISLGQSLHGSISCNRSILCGSDISKLSLCFQVAESLGFEFHSKKSLVRNASPLSYLHIPGFCFFYCYAFSHQNHVQIEASYNQVVRMELSVLSSRLRLILLCPK